MLVDLDKAREVKEEFTQWSNKPEELYRTCQKERMSVSQYFEKHDPTPIDENGNPETRYDAFDRHMAVLGLELHGPGQVSIQDLADGQARYLMPELVLREIQAGMEVHSRFTWKDLVAVVIPHKGATYHPLYIPNLTNDSALTRQEHSLGARAASAKGGGFPVVAVRRREKDIVLGDDGREIQMAYAVVRDYAWEDFAIFLRLIGAQISVDNLFDIYDLGITGDGTVGAATDTFAGVAGTLAYSDLVTNYIQYGAPFKMGAILAPQQTFETILLMAQFQDPLSGWKFQQNGDVVTPMGSSMKQIDATPGGTPTGTVGVTLDTKFAVRLTQSQPLTVESEKIISLKFDKAVVSEEKKFSIIADGAIRRIVWT